MSYIRSLDHVGMTVLDLDRAAAFFVALGLHEDGRTPLEGPFLDAVVGIPDTRTEIVLLTPPGGGPGFELARFDSPAGVPGSPDAPANEVGLRSVTFQVDDLPGAVARAAELGYGLVGGVGEHDGVVDGRDPRPRADRRVTGRAPVLNRPRVRGRALSGPPLRDAGPPHSGWAVLICAERQGCRAALRAAGPRGAATRRSRDALVRVPT
ncbi:VOC family protein [Propioniciclava coleopterorum]|uniref:VOC family protein n=1 Tax=Propioniciclava coleopterorum TaxID=2714937 RepID=UPI001FE77AF8|nr:VOC family protein [Propioniciclava coleopterorum]